MSRQEEADNIRKRISGLKNAVEIRRDVVIDNIPLKVGVFDHFGRLVLGIDNETYGEFRDVVDFEIMKLNSRILKVDVPHWIECVRSGECIRGNNVVIPEDAPGSVKTAISKYLYPNGEIRPGYKKAVAKVLKDKAEFQYAQISHSGFDSFRMMRPQVRKEEEEEWKVDEQEGKGKRSRPKSHK